MTINGNLDRKMKCWNKNNFL